MLHPRLMSYVQQSLLPELVPERIPTVPILDQAVTPEQRRREEALLRQHLPLLKTIYSQERWRYETLDGDDLFSVGLIGLWKAARRYDPSKGYRFSSLAKSFIVGEWRHYQRDKAFLVTAPGQQRERGCRIRRLLGQGLSLAQVRDQLHLSEEQVADALLATQPVSYLGDHQYLLEMPCDDEETSDE